jgi:hypothetical protein
MKSLWKIILCGALFFVLPLVLVVVTFQNWCIIKPNFFIYSLSDIISLISTGYIGIIIMIIFSNVSNNSMKRLEIITENITMLQSYSENILYIFSNSLNSSLNKNSQGHILRSLRIASNEFSNIQEFLSAEKKDNNITMLLKLTEENIINFKQTITDKPFQKNYKINENDIQYATDSHNKLKQNTQQIKLKLYK